MNSEYTHAYRRLLVFKSLHLSGVRFVLCRYPSYQLKKQKAPGGMVGLIFVFVPFISHPLTQSWRGTENLNGTQCFDNSCNNFPAPAGGVTLPARMSFALTGLP